MPRTRRAGHEKCVASGPFAATAKAQFRVRLRPASGARWSHNQLMNLPDPDHCYQALLSRDSRFDGRFFVGVRSTGIYCRPVCRVRTPRRENCTFYASAAAAECAGFRPCLRCRPEAAPGTAPIEAAARLARAAAELVEAGCGDGVRTADIAARLAISERHLRRVFADEFGVSPAGFLLSRRLQLARQMVLETALPVGEIALAAGFGSLRTFNRRFRTHYRMAPSELRARRQGDPHHPGLRLRLGYRPPLDWIALTAFLARRAIPSVEWVDTAGGVTTYRRLLSLSGGVGWVAVRPGGDDCSLEVSIDPALVGAVPTVLARMRRLFDLGCDPHEVAACLGELASRRPGLRVPGAADGFEMAARAIIGQQVSVAAARTLATRLATRFGRSHCSPWPELSRVFPAPATLASLPLEGLTGLGIMPTRARALIGLAQALDSGRLLLDAYAGVEQARSALLAIPGIGPWTADYIAMRALAWPDAFPEGDVGVHRALGESSRKAARERMQAYRPWRAYAVMQLWASLEDDHER